MRRVILLVVFMSLGLAGCGFRPPVRSRDGKTTRPGQTPFDDKPTTATPSLPTADNPDRPMVRVASCSEDSVCRAQGLCTAAGNNCIAGSNADCLGAAVCEDRGRCTARKGICVAGSSDDCAHSKGCEKGACIQVGDDCVATPESCRASLFCRIAGACTLREGKCVVGSDADCAQSSSCKTDGYCVESRGACVAK